jgi:hypothetical protein
MPDLNVKEPKDTKKSESLTYMLGYIRGYIKRVSGQRVSASEIVRRLVRDEYMRLRADPAAAELQRERKDEQAR